MLTPTLWLIFVHNVTNNQFEYVVSWYVLQSQHIHRETNFKYGHLLRMIHNIEVKIHNVKQADLQGSGELLQLGHASTLKGSQITSLCKTETYKVAIWLVLPRAGGGCLKLL